MTADPSALPSLCLAMIVRDEAAVIDRCLASVVDLLDSWVIVDTGSVDDTAARIQRTLGHLPGQIHRREWVDFGHNRSQLMALARGSARYLLGRMGRWKSCALIAAASSTVVWSSAAAERQRVVAVASLIAS